MDDLRHIEGASEDDYDLNKIFGDVFPMYQRQSALITAYSIFEFGLSNMCEYAEGLIQTSSSYKHDNKLSKIRNFLNRLQVCGVVPPEIHETFDFLDNDVRHIRNAWAHNNGKNTRGKVRKDIEGVEYVYSQLSLSPEFIAKVTKSMNYVAKTITDSIVRKRGS